ncbi:MAG: acyl-CoA/acyl-ACP dehydrogenase [Actinobacteria bacterium]|nr:acyl-CoA/acyl-ACP dehydrogenase [Actinomycetota bacterium]
MRFAFSDDQLLFRDTVRDFLAKECQPERVREAWANDDGLLPDVWAGLAEMGVIGLLVPEALGGLGMDELDLVLLLEETGRAALPGPVIDTVAVAAPTLARLQQAPDHQPIAGWLSELAAGTLLAATNFGSPLVGHADVASLVLLDVEGELHAALPGSMALVAQASVDGSRRLFTVDTARDSTVCLARDDRGRSCIEGAFDRGALAAAAQLLGLADRMLELTVGYVKQREQFGVPIGTFQAVKHHLADALLALSFARPAVYNAACSVARELPDAARDVSMAKACASDAAHAVGRHALQCHGAIGYTIEYDLHLYLKRAWALAASWGDAAWHRDRVGVALGI